MTTASLPGAVVGEAYSATLGAADGASPYRWSVVAGTLPLGLSLDASTGTLSGNPQFPVPVSYTFSITVADSWTPAQTAVRVFTVTTTRGESKKP